MKVQLTASDTQSLHSKFRGARSWPDVQCFGSDDVGDVVCRLYYNVVSWLLSSLGNFHYTKG